MSEYYLAVDIGASSGRHILGYLANGKLRLEEIYRFENGMDRRDGHLYWDVERLFAEIKKGLSVAKEIGKIPKSIAVDTWAVDYVLLDENNEIVGSTYGYRDRRTDGVDEEVYGIVPERELYGRTGIQRQSFNTIFQLCALKEQEPEILKRAQSMLMLPDYFHYRLTGNKVQEYTNATSTGLVNATTNEWDFALIEKIGLPKRLFLPIDMPGTTVGHFSEAVQEELGFDCEVVLPASHDTASAVMAVPAVDEDVLYISSGTWSLMGVENVSAVTSEAAQRANFTNEGGYDHRFRFLKNIMGLWMVQQVRHELDDKFSFAQLCDMAEKEKAFPSRVDVNDACFLSPENMQDAVREYCREHGQQVPESVGQMAAVIYRSLAESYAKTLSEIEAVTGKHYRTIHIVGGGSNAVYLNLLTAAKTGRRVSAGPGEATAIGNMLAQMISAGVFADLKEARACVQSSFDIRVYE